MSKSKKSQEKESPKKKSTGLRTAVKYGEISPELALHRLEEERKAGGYVGDSIVTWLKNKKKQLKNKPVEPVGENKDGDS